MQLKEGISRIRVFLIWIAEGQAGVFNLPHFVTPGEFAIGVEPEFIMTGRAAVGVNMKYTHGLSEMSNLTGILGDGGGDRQFRVGANFTFDIFPDMGNQPGIGVAFQGLYLSFQNAGALETTAYSLHSQIHVN